MAGGFEGHTGLTSKMGQAVRDVRQAVVTQGMAVVFHTRLSVRHRSTHRLGGGPEVHQREREHVQVVILMGHEGILGFARSTQSLEVHLDFSLEALRVVNELLQRPGLTFAFGDWLVAFVLLWPVVDLWCVGGW